MSEIAVLNKSILDDADVAFAVAACDIQLREHFVPLWAGSEYTPVRFYSSEGDLPVLSDIARLMVLSGTLGVSGALGYHTMDPLIRGVVLADAGFSVTLSHECLEMAADPTADRWVTMPDGRRIAVEVCDPVEADTYAIPVTILGETRNVRVSNFVTPAWFETENPTGLPLDYLGTKTLPPFGMTPGGYVVVMDQQGNTDDIWGRRDEARRARKLFNPTSRTYRRGARF